MKSRLFIVMLCFVIGLLLQLKSVSYGAKYMCEPEDLNDVSSFFSVYDTTLSAEGSCNKYVGDYYRICVQTYNKNKQAYLKGKCTLIRVKEYMKGSQKCTDTYYGNESTPSTTCTQGKVEFNPNFRRPD